MATLGREAATLFLSGGMRLASTGDASADLRHFVKGGLNAGCPEVAPQSNG